MYANVGDTVIIEGDLYLGVWLKAGTEGTVVDIPCPQAGQGLYVVEIKGKTYRLASAEFGVKGRLPIEKTVVVEDDGEPD